MTEKQDEGKGKGEATTAKQPAKKEKSPGPAPPAKGAKTKAEGTTRGRPLPTLLSLLALIVALGALGAGGWLYLEFQRLQSERTELTDRLQRLDAALEGRPTVEALDDLRGSLQTLDAGLQQARGEINQRESGTAELLTRLEGQLETVTGEQEMLQQAVANVRAVMGRDDGAWVLAEVEHLLRIANHQVRLENDLSSGIRALEAADHRLRDLGDPTALPVRSAIAEEITQLRNVERPDLPGIAMRLQAATSQARSLGPGKPQARSTPEGAPPTDGETSPEQPTTLAGRAWQWFTSLVSVSRRETPTEQGLKPGITKARQSIEADLAFARVALLEHDQVAYRERLDTALETLRDTFDTEDTAVANLIAELEDLRGAPLSMEIPDLSGSLAALRSYRNQQQPQSPTATTAPADASQTE